MAYILYQPQQKIAATMKSTTIEELLAELARERNEQRLADFKALTLYSRPRDNKVGEIEEIKNNEKVIWELLLIDDVAEEGDQASDCSGR
jgi:hypothetical protein